MKYNKQLRNNIEKYKEHIIPQYWFDYKDMKKKIKIISQKYKNILFNNEQSEEVCFICMDDNKNKKFMKTFCCNQYVHHTCNIEALSKCNFSCPMCRKNIYENTSYYINNDYNKLNYDVLALLSNIQLNIIKIENVYMKKLIINEKIMKRFCEINYISILKICKKIKKYINIECWDYFEKIININKIIRIRKKNYTLLQKSLICLHKVMDNFLPNNI